AEPSLLSVPSSCVGMASASVADSTSTPVVTVCAARCRSLSLRTRSARESERAVVAMNAANAKIVTAAAMARPSASLKSAARRPDNVSQPRLAGAGVATGSIRRAGAPPARARTKPEKKPHSGPGQRRAEDAYPQHEERRRRWQRHALHFAESVHSLRAIGIAEQRNEGDPNWKQRHQLLKPAPRAARRVEQP